MIAPNFGVSSMITEGDMPALVEHGVKSIINNRPDGEGFGLPDSGELGEAAGRHGLDYRYIPIIHGGMTRDNLLDFESALEDLEGPVIAFCNSGARSAAIYNIVKEDEVGDKPVQPQPQAEPFRPFMWNS